MSQPDDEAGGGPDGYSQDEFDKSIEQVASHNPSQRQRKVEDAEIQQLKHVDSNVLVCISKRMNSCNSSCGHMIYL